MYCLKYYNKHTQINFNPFIIPNLFLTAYALYESHYALEGTLCFDCNANDFQLLLLFFSYCDYGFNCIHYHHKTISTVHVHLSANT